MCAKLIGEGDLGWKINKCGYGGIGWYMMSVVGLCDWGEDIWGARVGTFMKVIC